MKQPQLPIFVRPFLVARIHPIYHWFLGPPGVPIHGSRSIRPFTHQSYYRQDKTYSFQQFGNQGSSNVGDVVFTWEVEGCCFGDQIGEHDRFQKPKLEKKHDTSNMCFFTKAPFLFIFVWGYKITKHCSWWEGILSICIYTHTLFLKHSRQSQQTSRFLYMFFSRRLVCRQTLAWPIMP